MWQGESVWRRSGEHYAACNVIQHDWFGGGSLMVRGDIHLWRVAQTSICKLMVMWLLFSVGMKSSVPLSDLTLVQCALGSSWCRTMSGLMWSECEGSSWMMKVLTPLIYPHWPESNWERLGHYVSVYPLPPQCPGAHWCPDPGLGGVILNPVLRGFMILVSIDHLYVILFSMNQQRFSTSIFCSLRSCLYDSTVPLIFLSSCMWMHLFLCCIAQDLWSWTLSCVTVMTDYVVTCLQ